VVGVEAEALAADAASQGTSGDDPLPSGPAPRGGAAEVDASIGGDEPTATSPTSFGRNRFKR